jgi:hypothetical protein
MNNNLLKEKREKKKEKKKKKKKKKKKDNRTQKVHERYTHPKGVKNPKSLTRSKSP